MTYDLNGADAMSAALWFLRREERRHEGDLLKIRRDIYELESRGVKLPKGPGLDTFFKIPGVDYEEEE